MRRRTSSGPRLPGDTAPRGEADEIRDTIEMLGYRRGDPLLALRRRLAASIVRAARSNQRALKVQTRAPTSDRRVRPSACHAPPCQPFQPRAQRAAAAGEHGDNAVTGPSTPDFGGARIENRPYRTSFS